MLYGQLQRKRRFRLNEAAKAVPGPQSKAIGINTNTKDTQYDMDELERIVSDNVRTIGDSFRISGLVKALRACKVKFTAGQLARFIENGGIRRIEAVDMCPNAASLARHLNMKDAQEAQSYIDGLKRDGIICGFGSRAFVSLPKEDWTRLSR